MRFGHIILMIAHRYRRRGCSLLYYICIIAHAAVFYSPGLLIHKYNYLCKNLHCYLFTYRIMRQHDIKNQSLIYIFQIIMIFHRIKCKGAFRLNKMNVHFEKEIFLGRNKLYFWNFTKRILKFYKKKKNFQVYVKLVRCGFSIYKYFVKYRQGFLKNCQNALILS